MIADVLGQVLTPIQRRLAALEKAPAKSAQETRSSEARRASGITPESRALISQARAVVAIARAARVLAH